MGSYRQHDTGQPAARRMLRHVLLACCVAISVTADGVEYDPVGDRLSSPITGVTVSGRTVLRVGLPDTQPPVAMIWLHAANVSAGTDAEWWQRSPTTGPGMTVYCPASAGASWIARRDEGHIRTLIREVHAAHPDALLVLAGSGGGARLISDIGIRDHHRIAAIICFDGLPVPPYLDARETSPPIFIHRGRRDRHLSGKTVTDRVRALRKHGYQVHLTIEERDRTLDAHAWDAITAALTVAVTTDTAADTN